MRAKSLGVLCTAVLFAATVAFAQNSSDQNQNNSSSSSSSTQAQPNSNAANPNETEGTQGNVMMGRVTKYAAGQSITVKMQNGKTHTWNLNNPNETANVSPDVKVGSHVKVSETNNNGQKALNIEPAAASEGGNAQTDSTLPKTASNMPVLGLLGLLSLAGAAGVRVYSNKGA